MQGRNYQRTASSVRCDPIRGLKVPKPIPNSTASCRIKAADRRAQIGGTYCLRPVHYCLRPVHHRPRQLAQPVLRAWNHLGPHADAGTQLDRDLQHRRVGDLGHQANAADIVGSDRCNASRSAPPSAAHDANACPPAQCRGSAASRTAMTDRSEIHRATCRSRDGRRRSGRYGRQRPGILQQRSASWQPALC